MKLIVDILIAILLFFVSCSKDIEVQDIFPFEIEAYGNTKELVSNTLETTLEVKPERMVTGTEYYFSYNSSGLGYYTNNGETLLESETYSFSDDLKENLIYHPSSAGEHEVIFNIWDSNQQTELLNYTYEITEGNGVSFSITTENSNINVSDNALVKVEIIEEPNLIVAENLSYELSFDIDDINATIEIDGMEYSTGDIISNLTASTFYATYQPSSEGDNVLAFNLEASNGKNYTSETLVNVSSTDFDFTFEPNLSEAMLGTETDIFFELEQNSDENLNYTIEISGQRGYASVGNSGLQELPNTFIYNGSNAITFYPREVNQNDFVVRVTASNGLTKTQTIPFNSTPIEFDFDISKEFLEVFNTNERVDLYENITINLDTPDNLVFVYPQYQLTVLSAVGDFYIRGVDGTKFPGQIMSLNGNSSLVSESHSLSFEFYNSIQTSGTISIKIENDTGYEVTKELNVNVITE